MKSETTSDMLMFFIPRRFTTKTARHMQTVMIAFTLGTNGTWYMISPSATAEIAPSIRFRRLKDIILRLCSMFSGMKYMIGSPLSSFLAINNPLNR